MGKHHIYVEMPILGMWFVRKFSSSRASHGTKLIAVGSSEATHRHAFWPGAKWSFHGHMLQGGDKFLLAEGTKLAAHCCLLTLSWAKALEENELRRLL